MKKEPILYTYLSKKKKKIGKNSYLKWMAWIEIFLPVSRVSRRLQIKSPPYPRE